MIGCDIRNMSDTTKRILMNEEIIAINQDVECRSPYRLEAGPMPDNFVLVKHLSDGSMAIGFFNMGDTDAYVSLEFWDLGLPNMAGIGLNFHDCIAHTDLGVKREYFAPLVSPHGCKVYRCNLVNLHDGTPV